MPHLEVWVHLVWSTKCREPVLGEMTIRKICSHISEQAFSKGIRLDAINGYRDHIHALVQLRGTQSVSFIAQVLKGESSHWVNRQEWWHGDFDWQDEYAAFSVSRYEVCAVRNYIAHQSEHHRVKTFEEEYNALMSQLHWRGG